MHSLYSNIKTDENLKACEGVRQDGRSQLILPAPDPY